MIDIDHFKKINDTYGHAVGDACIRHVAAVLKLQSRRSSDDVCRYGGEEFALILPNTDSHGALQLIESMREKLEAFPVQVEGHSISLTFSAGICTGLMDEEEQEVELLRQADQLLYEAKKAGRNCVKAAMMEHQHG
jgi:diguanylate cyclase (GGDEF)-like protein